ncbi:DUF397 domain-containing protein [Nocardia sp. NPDC005366]|uniref:DUF397 domain-containing protein n=1 Tax=Nocardia sp. NPDC005366 TaxID=3156878 RepID=UPI0033A56279
MTTPIRHGWRKSTFSNNGGASCVEVNFIGNQALVRDSKYLRNPANNPNHQPVLSMRAEMWATFCDSSANPTTQSEIAGVPRITVREDGWVRVTDSAVELVFTPDEWTAFIQGVLAGEFERAAA